MRFRSLNSMGENDGTQSGNMERRCGPGPTFGTQFFGRCSFDRNTARDCSGAISRTDGPPSSGEALYQQRCASCHQGGVARAADTKALRQLSAERIGFALAYGIMSQQGRDLSRAPGTPGCTEAGRVLEISRSVLAR